MTYTSHTRYGTVTRDSDGVVVAPTGDPTSPDYLAWAEWCAAGGIPNVDDGLSLEDAKAEVLTSIDRHAYAMRECMVAGTHPAEMSSWALKLAEAQQGGGPLLDAEAAARGITASALVAKVLSNAQALAMAEAAIAGAAGRHRDMVRSLPDIQSVINYDFNGGWPLFENNA